MSDNNNESLVYEVLGLKPFWVEKQSKDKLNNQAYLEEKKYFAMRGYLGQYVIVFPKENVVIVRLGRMEESTEEKVYIEEAFKMLDIT